MNDKGVANVPLISVVVPVYNVAYYLPKCIDSLLEQTYSNLEIILVNDGSTDESPQICLKYEKKDQRIKIINKSNGGLSEARNFGIDRATGTYLAFVDSDDHVHKNMFSILMTTILKHGADIAICGHYIEENGKLQPNRYDNTTIRYSREEALEAILMDKEINSFAWDKLYRSSLFSAIRYPLGRIFEDTATTYKVFDLANSVVRVNQALYYYLKRDDSITKTKSLKKYYDNFLGFYERFEFVNEKMPHLKPNARFLALQQGINFIDNYAVSNAKETQKKYYSDTLTKLKGLLKGYDWSTHGSKAIFWKIKLISFSGKAYISLYSLLHRFKKQQ
jgi:glycosyltransferase involved in cell wall biosynthesis